MAKKRIWPLKNLMAALVLFLIVANPVHAEDKKMSFSTEELEQLVAPIALHPDDLLGQILMASTYPLQVVQAARWTKKNANVNGKALEQAMQKTNWDPSVKGLTATPQVLEMMNENLEWTQKLGDAMLEQEADVMAAAQQMRVRAKKQGNLDSTKEQVVKTETRETTTYIIIERANPEVVYVPVYNPTIVYGPWPYPAYKPYWWYPPNYVAARAVWFGAAVVVGAAIWARPRWQHHNVTINVNRYNHFNRTKIQNNRWRHNVRHRGAVPYRNNQTARRYGAVSRNTPRGQAYRGRVATPRQGARPGPQTRQRPAPQTRQRPAPQTRQRPAQQTRQRPAPQTRQRPAQQTRQIPTQPSRARPAQLPTQRPTRQSGMRGSGGYNGVGNATQTRSHSARGNASRSQSRQRFGGAGGRRR